MSRWCAAALGVALLVAGAGCRKKSAAGGGSGAGAAAGNGKLAVGHGHACVLRPDRSIWCWGSNALGSVGVKSANPSQQYQATAVRVNVGPAKQIAIVSVGTCFESDVGFSCWGGALSNQDASPLPLPIKRPSRLIGGTAGCALDPGGTASCWGENTNARLAPGDRQAVTATFGTKLEPRALGVGTPLEEIAVGDRHACALAKDGRVLCWGLNNFGQHPRCV